MYLVRADKQLLMRQSVGRVGESHTTSVLCQSQVAIDSSYVIRLRRSTSPLRDGPRPEARLVDGAPRAS
jgi:hypothetical protein